MKYRLFTLVSLILASSAMSFAHEKKGHNVIQDFRYASCSTTQCIVITAPQAWISFLHGGFSTDGPTRFKLTNAQGVLEKEFVGMSASYKPEIRHLVLDINEDRFLLYSLQDGDLSIFGETPHTQSVNRK